MQIPITPPAAQAPLEGSYFGRAWYLFFDGIQRAVAQANDAQIAYATANLALTTTHQDIAGAEVTLNQAGLYLVTAVFYFVGAGAGDVGQKLIGILEADGDEQSAQAIFTSVASACSATVSQQWLLRAIAGGEVLQLRAAKAGGTGTSAVNKTHTSLTATWVGF